MLDEYLLLIPTELSEFCWIVQASNHSIFQKKQMQAYYCNADTIPHWWLHEAIVSTY